MKKSAYMTEVHDSRNNKYKISNKFIPIKNVRKISLSIISLFTEKIKILNKYPIAFDIKNVCTPNINIPTIPLIIAIYFAPITPDDDRKITGKGKPCFCDGFPIIVENIKANNEAIKPPNKTTKKFKSYTK